MSKRYTGLDNDPNSIFRASKNVVKYINKRLNKDEKEKNALENQNTSTLNPSSDVEKNLSLFTLDIKQLTNLIDSFVDYINKGYRDKKVKGGSRSSGRSGRSGRSRSVKSDQSYYDPFIGSVVGSNINSAPIQSENSDEDSGSDSGSDIGSEYDQYDPLLGQDIGFNDPDDNMSQFTDSFSGHSSNSYLMKELNRIANLVHHATILWEDSIKPNINFLSKFKMGQFLNSTTIKDFEHSLDGFDDLQGDATIQLDYPELARVFANTLDDIETLMTLINKDIKIISGRAQGNSTTQVDPEGNEVEDLVGAGFLHIPTVYNNQLKYSKTKYLM